MRGRLLAVVLGAGCTEPNPNVGEDGDATGSTSMSMSMGTSTSPTASSSPTMSGPTSGATDMETSESDPTAGSSGSSCPSTHRCVTEPPDGWNGPVAVAETPPGERPDCTAEYPELAIELFGDLDSPEPICSCECGDPLLVTCQAPVLEYFQNNATCAIQVDSWNISGCVSVSAFASDYWRVEEVPVQGGHCNPVFSEEVPEASWGVAWTACGGGTLIDGCEPGSVCAPVPALPLEPNLCIYRNGVHDCPGGVFTEKLTYHEQIGDTRGCTPCTCDDPEGFCDGTIRTFAESGCTGTLSNQFFPTGNCVQASAGIVVSANVSGLSPEDPTCAPQGGQPEGATVPILPRTFCCTPGA